MPPINRFMLTESCETPGEAVAQMKMKMQGFRNKFEVRSLKLRWDWIEGGKGLRRGNGSRMYYFFLNSMYSELWMRVLAFCFFGSRITDGRQRITDLNVYTGNGVNILFNDWSPLIDLPDHGLRMGGTDYRSQYSEDRIIRITDVILKSEIPNPK